jgi:hypothetical protein
MRCKDRETILHYFSDWVDEYYVYIGTRLNIDDKIKQKTNQILSIFLQQWKYVSFLSKAEANSSKNVQNKSLGIVFNVWRQYTVHQGSIRRLMRNIEKRVIRNALEDWHFVQQNEQHNCLQL